MNVTYLSPTCDTNFHQQSNNTKAKVLEMSLWRIAHLISELMEMDF